MHNITIISSKHVELGKCNSLQLLEILNSINPEVIFEELPKSYFGLYYGNLSTKFTLETIAIANFLKSKKAKQVLVDTTDFPHIKALMNNYSIMLEHCLNFRQQNVLPIKEEILKSNQLLNEQGFDYLNSELAEVFQDNFKVLINDCLLQINSRQYYEAAIQWQSLIDFRENHMIKSIYEFSEQNEYNEAVFTLGVAHRKSIKAKINDVQNKSVIKLNWNFYGE